MLKAEGGLVNHNVPGDRGGQTYGGIARNYNPDWIGWDYLDRSETPPEEYVQEFYHECWWEPIRGAQIASQKVATGLFKFAVNTSGCKIPTMAIRMAQLAAKVDDDGKVGPATIAAINGMHEEMFLSRFTLAQIQRYIEICNADRSRVQAKQFLLGWINRALAGYELEEIAPVVQRKGM